MKGQSEVISVILMTGILIGVVGSVYFWGLPLIQKNKDIAIMENSEDFMRNLNTKIKFVANNGGRDQIKMLLPGIIKFDVDSGSVDLVIDTKGTIYATDSEIPLGRNPECGADTLNFALGDPETLCVKSTKLSKDNYRTTYTLKYVNLTNEELLRIFKIELTKNPVGSSAGGEDSNVIFEHLVTNETVIGNRTLIKSWVQISIV